MRSLFLHCFLMMALFIPPLAGKAEDDARCVAGVVSLADLLRYDPGDPARAPTAVTPGQGWCVDLGAGDVRIGALHIKPGTIILPNKATLVTDAPPKRRGLIRIGHGAEIDQLAVRIPAGRQFERLMRIDGNVRIKSLAVFADEQQKNSTLPSRGMIWIAGGRVRIGHMSLALIDTPLIIQGRQRVLRDVRIDRLVIRSYVRGIMVRNARRIALCGGHIHVKSANAFPEPGHNGILISATHDLLVQNMEITDSGEHAIRMGGSYGAEQVNRRAVFKNIVMRRAGKSGLKLNPSVNQTIRDVWVDNLKVYDSAFQTLPSPNADGVRVERSENIFLQNITVMRQEGDVSSHAGLFIRNVKGLYVEDFKVSAPRIAGIVLSTKGIDGDTAALEDIAFVRRSIESGEVPTVFDIGTQERRAGIVFEEEKAAARLIEATPPLRAALTKTATLCDS